jgi:hypothetical protein
MLDITLNDIITIPLTCHQDHPANDYLGLRLSAHCSHLEGWAG